MKNSICSSFFVMATIVWAGLYPVAPHAQDWVEMMQDPKANFYDVQRSFNQYWQGKDLTSARGWKQFKRWEYFMEPRVYPSGRRPDPDQAAQAFTGYMSALRPSRNLSGANWTALGPSFWQSISYNPGIGRVNCTAVDPTNSDIIYAGVPSGGLWKSTDAATTWSTTTDGLPVLGVTSIAIDPADPNTIYIASGDGDAGDTYSIGVLKSSNGGDTWSATGLNFAVTQTRVISKLLIHPTDSNILLAATDNGVYKTMDAGSTWSLVLSGNFHDMEFKPGVPATVYVCGTTFYLSTDTGSSFSRGTSGLPGSAQVVRMAIAVTAANSDYVYLIAGNSTDSGLQGVYRSTNSGVSFSIRASNPNILGYAGDGSSDGGQSWYDLAIAASPDNAEVIYAGGINIWKSLNGGLSWSLNAFWFYPATFVPYVHADVHALDFYGSTLLAGSDGGLFMTTTGGLFWGDLSAGLVTTQFYRISGYPANADLIYGGSQDNGTNRLQAGAWTHVLGADGMECLVDYSDSNIVYACIQSGGLRKSVDGGNSFSPIDSTITTTEEGYWVTPYVIHPAHPKTLFAGYRRVWKTTNGGDSWIPISSFLGSSSLWSLAVAASNPNHIYAATDRVIYKTTNGGAHWTDISSGLPTTRAAMTYIAVADDDPNKLWGTFSGYVNGNKVFSSTNGGDTWTNFSGTLPNLPVNCIVREDGSNDALYVGTDVGVYYRDRALADWQPFNTGLPNVIVSELEIHAGTGKLRAGTYGRGLWESPTQSGVAQGPKSLIKPLALYFDTLEVGLHSSRLRVAITSIGAAPLTISAINNSSSSFQLVSAPSLPVSVPSSGELALLAEFTPLSPGAHVDSIRIQSNDPARPLAAIALSGYALAVASFRGVIKDSLSDLPIQATLEFLRQGQTVPRAATTDVSGSYSVALLEGAYHVTILPEIPYPQVQLENVVHGQQGTAKDFLLTPAPVVLVEDDSAGTAGAVYRSMLEELGYHYAVWNTSAQGATVPAERLRILAEPAVLLWTTGETSTDVLTAQDGAVIRGHLDNGGTLLLSGDNIAEAAPESDRLLSTYLGVNFNSNYSQPIIRGFAGDPISNGIVTGALGASKDQLQLNASARNQVDRIFRYGTSAADTVRIAGVRAENAAVGWRAVYLGFRLEIASQINRKTIFARTLDWLSDLNVEVEEKEVAKVPLAFHLEQNYPNPFNPTTKIEFGVADFGLVSLKVYDVMGREVATLVNARLRPGDHEVTFDTGKLSGGLYFYRLRAGDFTMTRKMIVTK